jgi:antitoxin (DNA-binding transcriptional repressor) of toxin-antitoxin stability system
MAEGELKADRLEDGAILDLKGAPETWIAGDSIEVRRDGEVVAELTALDEPGEFLWRPSGWLDLHIRLERVDDSQARVWLRPHHRELLSRMKIAGYR